MNSSYKIALIASVVLCVVVIGYYTAQRHATPGQAAAASSQQEIDGNTPASGSGSGVMGDDARPTGAIRPLGMTSGGTLSGAGSDRASSNSSRGSVSDPAGGNASRSIEPLGPGSQSSRSGTGTTGAGSSGTSSQDRGPRPLPVTAGGPVGGGSTGTPSPAPALTGQAYTIKPGDNFHALAKRLYGSEKHWVDIAQANPSIDPIRLKVGQTIRLPNIATAAPGGGAGTSGGSGTSGQAAAPAPKSLTHIVKPGETLASISKRYYKTTDKWEMLFRINKETIGADPDDLEAGMKLTIPPAE